MSVGRVGPEPIEDNIEYAEMIINFAENILEVSLDYSRDYDVEQDWERIVLTSEDPDFSVRVVVLDFAGDCSVTVLIGDNGVIELEENEDIFDVLVETQDSAEGGQQK